MKFQQALDIRPREVISLVGGGGKTTIMFALARELTSNGNHVIMTTTTRIIKPLSSETQLLLIETDDEQMIKTLLQNVDKYCNITLASKRFPSGKLIGISPELVDRLSELDQAPYIIVEADGASRKSLKAPNLTEPVIPGSTSLVIPVVGVDAAGRPLTRDYVFRPEIASSLSGTPLGAAISTEAIARLITHPQGIIKGSPVHSRIIPFINKVDLKDGLSIGRDVAHRILAKRHPQIERVLLGQAHLTEPVVEIIEN